MKLDDLDERDRASVLRYASRVQATIAPGTKVTLRSKRMISGEEMNALLAEAEAEIGSDVGHRPRIEVRGYLNM